MIAAFFGIPRKHGGFPCAAKIFALNLCYQKSQLHAHGESEAQREYF